jgi:hypothetical protein
MSILPPTPDFDGLDASQRRLVADFGRDIRFYGPADVIYDPALPSSAFDDEGIPLDPLAVASGSNEDTSLALAGLTVTGSAHCNVVFSPLQTSLLRRDQTAEQAVGIRSGLNRDLILNIEDAPQADGASHFGVGQLADDGTWTSEDDELYRISQSTPDTFGRVRRFIVYGERTQ